MPYFTYKAKDLSGNYVNGLVEAPSESVAARLLREKHLVIVSLAIKTEGNNLQTYLDKFKKVSLKDMVNFTRQMATLLTAGLSIPESLTIIRNQTKNPTLVAVYADIEHHIISGGNLANALSRHPSLFTPVYIALVKSGEASGSLDRILTRMAETLENQMEFRAKVKGAMIYPLIVVIGMIAVIFILMTVVVPRMTDLYNDFGVDLPITTQILVGISNIFVQFWWLILIVAGGGFYGFLKWRQTPLGQLFLDSLILKIPIFGDLQTKVILSEFTRTLGMLISSGIHILDALHFLKDSVGNLLFKKAVLDIAKKIEKGFPMGETFSQHEIFPPIVSQMIKVGEETGKLDETLAKLASYFEQESNHLLKNLTTALEPAIMVVLGVGVGFIVFSIITPIYSLTNAIR